MGIITVILLALGLSTDAFAVALSNGIYGKNITRKDAVRTALTFGLFQGLMPVLGFALGTTFHELVSRFQHWIALLLLGAIGVNMLVDALKELHAVEENSCPVNVFTTKNLVMQGIATSIDALAAGISFAVLELNIGLSAPLIGIITFFCCLLGVEIGKKCGSLLGTRARLIGGCILIFIGVKIFFENQFL
ncbi:MAG TPA: manganese efflux pump [Clostridiales bacterium]|nr:manganese efflux pump [Clostridiales bacterium]